MTEHSDRLFEFGPPVTTHGGPVVRWPSVPPPGASYSFVGLSREQVNQYNHGLHKFPAKFIPQVAQWALQYSRTQSRECVLDPFSGSGTAVLEAALNGDMAVGFDISPLAVLISGAKVSTITASPTASRELVADIVRPARHSKTAEQARLTAKASTLHHTWWNWFRAEETISLLSLVEAINAVCENREQERLLLLACLSSVTKRASYLNEDQIKVRYDQDKQLLDPFVSFAQRAPLVLERQSYATKKIEATGGSAFSACASATRLPMSDHSVDRVITSPPYINAVDYTMAHKYNMFLLGIVPASHFKKHRRQYIGMSERGVTANDLADSPPALHSAVDPYVTKLWEQDRPVSRNRAFVVWQYFDGMLQSFQDMMRVMRPGAIAVVVVGSTNRICGLDIPTAALLEELALSVGFRRELVFLHELANRSSMRLNRASTGGIVKTETVLVLRTPA